MNNIYFHSLIIIIIKISLCDLPDYSTFKIIPSDHEYKFLQMFYLEEPFQVHQLTENGFDGYKNFEGSDYNTEFIYDSNNTYLVCLSDTQILKIDNTFTIKKKNLDSNYQYNNYKCSISLFQNNAINYIIITNTYNDFENKVFKNVMIKSDIDLNYISNYTFFANVNLDFTYYQLFQCKSFNFYSSLFCVYIDLNILKGFFINDDFNEKEELQDLFDENLQLINFKLFSLNTYSILLIAQNKNLDELYINLISRENSHLLNRNLLKLNEKTSDSLNSIFIENYSENSFLMVISNKYYLKIYWVDYSLNEIIYNVITIKGDEFKNLKFTIYFNLVDRGMSIGYCGMENENGKVDIYSFNLTIPNEMMKCSMNNLKLKSKDENIFNVDDIIINPLYEKSILKISKINGNNDTIVDFENNNKETIKYSVGNYGESNYLLSYYFEKKENYNFTTEYSASNCEISIKVCYDKCGSCNEYSDNEEEMKCLTCKDNYYLSSVKEDYCSSCYDENIENSLYSIWYYNLEKNKSECLYNNKYCSEIISLNKPYMIYNTFECVESCPYKYKYYLGYYCVDVCNKENMKSNGVKCECKNGYKININKEENTIECIEDCPNLFDNELNECVDSLYSNDQILFNNTLYSECPLYTKEITKNNSITCECEYKEYKILNNNKLYIGCTISNECPENMYTFNNKCIKECPIYNYINTCVNQCPNDTILIKNNCLTKDDINNDINDYAKIIYMEKKLIENDKLKIEVYNSNGQEEMRNISKIDLSECEKILREKYKMTLSDYFIILKIEIIRNDNPTNQVEYAIYNNKFEIIDLKICSESYVKINHNLNFSKINYKKMESLSKNGYDIFNPNDKFYTDICSKYKSEYGTDVINRDRRNDYYHNYSLCEEKCKYNGLNFYNYSINCICQIKYDINFNLRDFSFITVYEIFHNALNPANFKVIKCYKDVFNSYNIFSNLGQIFTTSCLIIEIFLTVFFIKFGMENLLNLINNVIIEKNIDLIKSKNEKDENSEKYDTNHKFSNPPKKNHRKKSSNLTKANSNNSDVHFSPPIIYHHHNQNSNHFLDWYKNSQYSHSLTSRKNNNIHNSSNSLSSSKNNIIHNEENELENTSEKIDKVLNFNHIDDTRSPRNNKNEKIKKSKFNNKRNGHSKVVFFGPQVNVFCTNQNSENKIMQIIKQPLSYSPNKNFYQNEIKYKTKIKTLEEISLLGFNASLKYDNSGFFEYYFFLLKYHHLIIFTFLNRNDNNLKTIKIILFVFSLNLYLFFSAIFFNDNSFTYVYKHYGKFDYFGNIPRSIFSSLCCGMIKNLLNRLSLSQRIIHRIKNKTSLFEASYLFNKVRNIILYRISIFFVILYIFMIFFWYYISAFCGVYNNSQKTLFKSNFQSFIISMLFPFIFCLLTVIARKIALKNKWKYIFNLSVFLNYF